MATNPDDIKKEKQPVRWEVMVILLTSLFIAFIVFSGVWHLSSFDSMVGYTQGVYSHTDDWEGVNEGYEDMLNYFSHGYYQYTYRIAGISIGINQGMVENQEKDTYINAVLNMYTASLYHIDTLTGIKGAIHTVAGYDAHEMYGILMVLSLAAVLVTMRYMYIRARLVDFLKQVGLSLAGASAIALAMLYLIYMLMIDSWIATNETIYKEGLPIIAAMIKEWYTLYMAALIAVGILLLIPALISLLSKGKEKKETDIQVEVNN
jgi:hypothetical protein